MSKLFFIFCCLFFLSNLWAQTPPHPSLQPQAAASLQSPSPSHPSQVSPNPNGSPGALPSSGAGTGLGAVPNPSGGGAAQGGALGSPLTNPQLLPPPPIDNQATVVPPEASKDKFFYDETIGRDPFKIPTINAGKGAGPDQVINEDSLEGAPIPEGVKVLAIIYDTHKPRALIRNLGNNKTYLVFKKSRVGLGGGLVEAIREDEVVVVRTVETEGETKVENVILRLKDKENKKVQH